MTDNKTACETIVSQLGGRKIFVMAFSGATYGQTFPGTEDRAAGIAPAPCLTLKIAPALVRGALSKATHVQVILNPDDTYRIDVLRITRRGLDVKTVANCLVCYADGLRERVESMTGLRLSL